MKEPEFDNRKNNRKKSIEDKRSQMPRKDLPEDIDYKKINKAFKREKQNIIEEEEWEEWKDYYR